MKNLIAATLIGTLGFLGGAPAADASSLPRVILDTDMRGDCDDVGSLAVLHALADNGECEIIGVIASTTGPHVVGTIAAINAYYGRPYLPVGLGGTVPRDLDNYAPVVGDPAWFPLKITNEAAPDSTTLYRKLLHGSPDDSVTIVVVGGQPCVHELLKSKADHEDDGSINMSGAELVAAKVHELVLMAGGFTDPDQSDYNVTLDIEAAQTIARDWPGRVVYSGIEIGTVIKTGSTLRDPQVNPVAMSYKLFRGTEGKPSGLGRGWGVIGNRSSWDQTAVYYGARGLKYKGEVVWSLGGPVSVSITDRGQTRYQEDPRGGRYYMVQEMAIDRTAAIIEDLMVQPPRASVSLASPSWGQAVAMGDEIVLKADVTARGPTIEKVVFLVDGKSVAEVSKLPFTTTWRPPAPGSYSVQAYADGQGSTARAAAASPKPPSNGSARFYTRTTPLSVIERAEADGVNARDSKVNLALVEGARLTGSVPDGQGRGTPEAILYDPAKDDYHVRTDWNEYGVAHGHNLALITEESPFYWQASWEKPMNVNEITFGGTYYNQPQPFAMWKVQYRHDGRWRTLLEGQGGWINTGIFLWGGQGGPAITADAVRVIVCSDGKHPVASIHLRGRGGKSENFDDRRTTPKAGLIRYH